MTAEGREGLRGSEVRETVEGVRDGLVDTHGGLVVVAPLPDSVPLSAGPDREDWLLLCSECLHTFGLASFHSSIHSSAPSSIPSPSLALSLSLSLFHSYSYFRHVRNKAPGPRRLQKPSQGPEADLQGYGVCYSVPWTEKLDSTFIHSLLQPRFEEACQWKRYQSTNPPLCCFLNL